MNSRHPISLAALAVIAILNSGNVLAGPNDSSLGSQDDDPAADNGTGPYPTNENSAIRPNSGTPNAGQRINESSAHPDGMPSANPQTDTKAPGSSNGNTVGTDTGVGGDAGTR